MLQYVSKTLKLGLKFNKKTDTHNNILDYTDFNFASSKPDQKLTKE